MSVEEADMAAPTPAGLHETKPVTAEIEIKFHTTRSVLEKVLAGRQLRDAIIAPERLLLSTYFDSPGRELQHAGLTLRLRRKGRSIPVLGVKWTKETATDLFTRGEVEIRSPNGNPDIELFEPAIRDLLKARLGDQALDAVFKTCVKRRTVVIDHGRSKIELAFDDGVILANDQSRPLTEVELELKQGSKADLLDLAGELAQEYGLSLDFEPKAAKGYHLADQATARAQKTKSLQLAPSASFDDIIAAVIANCLGHFTANWASLRASEAPESVHQLRVALRRLRSALSIFRKRIVLPELDDIRARARNIASALGPARECDAFRQNALSGPFRDQPNRLAAAARLLEAVESRRVESYVAARRVIDDPATSLFVLEVQSFLQKRGWRTALQPEDLGLLTSPARDFAGEVLERLRRRALKRGKHMPDMPDEERHELRIALKNLRYAVEFFGQLFDDDREQRSLLNLVSGLQEDLGTHNDAATAEAFIGTLNLSADPQGQFAAGYLLGFYRHATRVADTQLAKTWRNFRRARTFWA